VALSCPLTVGAPTECSCAEKHLESHTMEKGVGDRNQGGKSGGFSPICNVLIFFNEELTPLFLR
jgi:hypothetical protein